MAWTASARLDGCRGVVYTNLHRAMLHVVDLAQTAADPDALYAFPGARGQVRWPMRDGAGLGAVGTWNLLWRLGYRPAWLGRDDPWRPAAGDVLFVHADADLDASIRSRIDAWCAAGGRILASGYPSAWAWKLPAGAPVKAERCSDPYAALAYLWPEPTSEAPCNHAPQLVAPPRWPYLRLSAAADSASTAWRATTGATGAGTPDSPRALTPGDRSPGGPAGGRPDQLRAIGALASIQGERQTPGRALVREIAGAFAALCLGDFAYLNASPMAAFQAWLQGQEELGPWMAWRHRLFWLDEMAAFLGRVLAQIGFLPPDAPRPGIPGLGETTVVLRHDMDSSDDPAYLDEEVRRGLAGTHALLMDTNRARWVQRLSGQAAQESAFHYNTLASPSLLDRAVDWLRPSSRPYRPARKEIVGIGLARQVAAARDAGIGIRTLHRHGAFLVYPEWIDALEACLAEHPQVLGASSLLRGHVLRWGVDRVDGIRGYMGEWPDAQFPLWLPFKLAHAGRAVAEAGASPAPRPPAGHDGAGANAGRDAIDEAPGEAHEEPTPSGAHRGRRAVRGTMVPGWESASVMEMEPDLIAQILDTRIPGLPQRVLTLGYHPAHAGRPTFAPGGSLGWFREILDLFERRGVAVRTLAEVYRLCDAATGTTPAAPAAPQPPPR